MSKKIIAVIIFLIVSTHCYSAPEPILNFSDIISGPKTGVGDGIGSGAIVTIWGNNLGSTQGNSTITVGGVHPYVYYWKDANGILPSGPSNLQTYHQMQEICFSIPATTADGLVNIVVTVDGETSTLPFTVRAGNIYHVKSTGSDSNDGSFDLPWLTLQGALNGTQALGAGDILYSHGVGATSAVEIGIYGGIVGNLANPVAVISYPNTTCTITASDRPLFYNYSGGNEFFVFSKWTMVDEYSQSFSLFMGSRIIGNYITGPTITEGVAGIVGGNCNGLDPDLCGAHKILGNEAYQYGDIGNVDTLEHLIYISNRSGFSAAEGYEIAWNNLHDNPVYQGIHIYDQSDCGGWSTPIKIHHNVVKNNGGNAININFNCTDNATTIDVYNNLTIIEDDYNATGNSAAVAAIRVQASTSTVVNVTNNTFWGWLSQNTISTGVLSFNNNIFQGNRGVNYVDATPDTYDNNLFWDITSAVTPPVWAEINQDPILISFSPGVGSLAINAGNDSILSYGEDVDLVGEPYISTFIDLGAFEYVADTTTVTLEADKTATSPATYTGTASAPDGETISTVVSSNGYTVTITSGAGTQNVAFTVSGVLPTITDTITATASDASTGQDSITITLQVDPPTTGGAVSVLNTGTVTQSLNEGTIWQVGN